MSNKIEKNISIFIDREFPEYFRTEGPLLVQFMKYYYEWLEQEGNLVYQMRSLDSFRSSLDAPDYFFEFLRDEFMRDIPTNLVADDRRILRRITDFYKSKGDEKSYRLLFRILYNTEISFYYPGQDILRASSGKWSIEKYISISPIMDLDSIAHVVVIRGETSGSTCRIDRIETNEIGAGTNIFLTSIFGDFIQGENLVNTLDNTVIAKVLSNGVQSNPGRWLNTDGFLSSDKKLQDNFYYQVFSYEINSPLPVNNYRQIVNDLVHPSGMKMFGRLSLEIGLDLPFDVEVLYNTTSSYSVNIVVDNIGIRDINLAVSAPVVEKVDVSTNQQPPEFTVMTNGVLTGTVGINGGTIADFANVPISEIANIPFNMLGTQRLLMGTGTHFKNQNLVKDSILTITSGANTGTYIVTGVFSNTFLTITPQYQYTSLVGGTATFWTYLT